MTDVSQSLRMRQRLITSQRRGSKLVLLALAALCGASGCQLGYFLTDPDATKKVPAEYDKIGSRRVGVVCWADRSTLDEYPTARRQVVRSLLHYLKKHLENAKFIPESKVYRLQEKSGADWEAMTNQEIAEDLGCDVVIRIDLLEFTTRASDTPQLQKARISGNIRLYDIKPKLNTEAAYDSDVKITYPKGSIHGAQDMTEADLLHGAVEYFAESVAQKFYEHEVKLQEEHGG